MQDQVDLLNDFQQRAGKLTKISKECKEFKNKIPSKSILVHE